MITGYAVEVVLLKWYKRDEDPTDFEKIYSHYVGSFTKEQADDVYKMLDSSLSNQADQHGGRI